jgi:hypothetical protein
MQGIVRLHGIAIDDDPITFTRLINRIGRFAGGRRADNDLYNV